MQKKIGRTLSLIVVAALLLESAVIASLFLFDINTTSNIKENNQPPIASISSNIMCGKVPLTVLFECIGFDYDGNIVSYSWNFGDGTISQERNPQYVYQNEGEFCVNLTLKDDDGDIGSDTVEIHVFENYPPVAYVSADTTTGRAPFKLQLHGEGKDGDGHVVSYQWNFDDGIVLNEKNGAERDPTCLYLQAGVYVVNFTVTDDDGATGTAAIKIEVKPNLMVSAYRGFLYLRWIMKIVENIFSFSLDGGNI